MPNSVELFNEFCTEECPEATIDYTHDFDMVIDCLGFTPMELAKRIWGGKFDLSADYFTFDKDGFILFGCNPVKLAYNCNELQLIDRFVDWTIEQDLIDYNKMVVWVVDSGLIDF